MKQPTSSHVHFGEFTVSGPIQLASQHLLSFSFLFSSFLFSHQSQPSCGKMHSTRHVKIEKTQYKDCAEVFRWFYLLSYIAR